MEAKKEHAGMNSRESRNEVISQRVHARRSQLINDHDYDDDIDHDELTIRRPTAATADIQNQRDSF